MDTLSGMTHAIDTQQTVSHYNSEWNKLCLLLWKNSRLSRTVSMHFIIMFLIQMCYCIFPIIHRFKQLDLNVVPLQLYNSFPLNLSWNALNEILDERIQKLQLINSKTKHNVFVPQKKIGYAPNGKLFRDIMENSMDELQPMTIEEYDSCDQLKVAVGTTFLYCGICFSVEKTTEDTYNEALDEDADVNLKIPLFLKYTLIYPSYLRFYNYTFVGNTWQTNALYPMHHLMPIQDDVQNFIIGYLREGFVYVQHTVATNYIKLLHLERELDTKMPQVLVNRFPLPEHHNDQLLDRMDFHMSLMLILSVSYPILTTAAMIVREKEEKSKIFTQIAGIDNYLHFLSWVIKSFIHSFFTSFIVIILLKIQWSSGLAIFNNTSLISWASVIVLYNISSICFCLMVTAFCNSTRTVVYATAFLWFFTYIPYWAAANYTRHLLSTIQIVTAVLFHNTALGYVVDIILIYEEHPETYSYVDFVMATNLSGNIKIGQYMCIFVIQAIVYLLIGIYVEELMPRSNEKFSKFAFLRSRKYSLSEKEKSGSEYRISTMQGESLIHEIASANPVLVEVKSVTKNYGDNIIVNNFNLQLRENEITILTGHNGSGKTTIITMICGLLKPTSGSIKIDGFNVFKDQKYACASLGVSMENSSLYNDLTVEDQLRFFSYLRGLNPESVESDIEKYLNATNLLSKRTVRTKFLPLGIRQELSICCALVGHSRIVILDEPHMCLEPRQRRLIWNLLMQEKRGRTILIATNFVESMNYLADRIAIISNGELQCIGSPAFLYKMYGQGYRLAIHARVGCNLNQVTRLFRKYIPNITVASKLGNRFTYLIEEKYASFIKDISHDLEENLHTLGIERYILSQVNLRDITVRMGSYMPPHENRTRLFEVLNGLSIYTAENYNLQFMEIKERVRGFKRFVQHFVAYFKYNWLITRYHKVYFFKQFLLPPIFTLLAFTASTFQYLHSPTLPMDYSLEQYPSTTTAIYIHDNTSEKMRKIAESYSQRVFWLGTKHRLEDTGYARFEEYILGKPQTLSFDTHANVGISILLDRVVCWYNHFAMHAMPITFNLYHNALQSAVAGAKSEIKVRMEPLNSGSMFSDAQFVNSLSFGVLMAGFIMYSFCFISNGIVFSTIHERTSGFRHIQETSGLIFGIYWIVRFLNDTVIIAITALLTVLTIITVQISYITYFSITSYAVYFCIIFCGGYCLYSFNYLIAEFFSNEITCFITSLMAGGLSLLIFCHYQQNYNEDIISKPTQLMSKYLLFIPHLVLCGAIETTYYVAAVNAVCKHPDIHLISEMEQCTVKPNCCEKYPYIGYKSEISYYLVLLIMYTILFWAIIIVKRQKVFWNIFRLPKDNFISQLIDHHLRHDNNNTRYSEQNAYLEARQIQHLSGNELRDIPLVCDRIGKIYGHYSGVDRFSLILRSHEIVAVIGHVGSGNSCLCRLITGVEDLSFGRIYVKGISVLRDRQAASSLIGYSLENHLKLPEVTIKEILIYFCRLHDYPPQYIDDICINLAKVLGIYHHYEKTWEMISLGTIKTVMCAFALLGNRPLLIMDSISINIDQATRYMIWRILREASSRGTSILYTCNNYEDLSKYCTRMCVLSYGRCCYMGSLDDFDLLYMNHCQIAIKLYHKILDAKQDVNTLYIYLSYLDKLKRFMKNQFPTSFFRCDLGNRLIFILPLESVKMSHLFNTIFHNMYYLNIEHFEIMDAFNTSFEDFSSVQKPIYR